MNIPVSPLTAKKDASVYRDTDYRSGVIAALDIGTSKVSCFIAQKIIDDDSGKSGMRIIGVGHQVSKGLRGGVVVDMVAAEKSIRKAIDAAERMANMIVKKVVVGVTSPKLASSSYKISLNLNGFAVNDEHMGQALLFARDKCQSTEVEVLHAIPVSYTVDDSFNVDDPRGLFGEKLIVNAHAITSPVRPVRNLLACIEKCHLKVDTLVATPYASALACLVEDEMELGSLSIDMGGGSTGFTVFHSGAPVFTGSIAVGGNHITADIAQGLGVSLATAERIKTLYGSALSETIENDEQFDVPLIGESGEEGLHKIQRSDISRIIRPRIEETFELLLANLNRSGINKTHCPRAVLTGGGAMLTGARELAQHMIERQVRIGRPIRLSGLPEASAGTAFSSCAGLIAYKKRRSNDMLPATPELPSFFVKAGKWLKRNF